MMRRSSAMERISKDNLTSSGSVSSPTLNPKPSMIENFPSTIESNYNATAPTVTRRPRFVSFFF